MSDPAYPHADRRALVEPENLPARLDANWERVLVKERRKRHKRVAALVISSVSLIALVSLVALSKPTSVPWMGEALITETSAAEVHLPDGSRIRVTPASEVRREYQQPHEVRLRLHRGEAHFDVAPRPNRAFVVMAGHVEVRVIGTAFTVACREDVILIRVDRGTVDVRIGTEIQRLRAGDHRRIPTVGSRPHEAIPSANARNTVEEDGPRPSKTPNVRLERSASEQRDRNLRTTRPESPSLEREPMPNEDPASLLHQAQTARREGRYRDAVALYGRITQEFPRDSLAALTALERGRLLMDELGDTRAALTSFQLAIRRAPASPLREEAMARIVRSYEEIGNVVRCREARDAYLARYPEGRYMGDLSQRCR